MLKGRLLFVFCEQGVEYDVGASSVSIGVGHVVVFLLTGVEVGPLTGLASLFEGVPVALDKI